MTSIVASRPDTYIYWEQCASDSKTIRARRMRMGISSDIISKDAEQFPWSFTRICSQWWAVPSYWAEGADREWDEAIKWCEINLEDDGWMTCIVTRSILTSQRSALIFKLRWC